MKPKKGEPENDDYIELDDKAQEISILITKQQKLIAFDVKLGVTRTYIEEVFVGTWNGYQSKLKEKDLEQKAKHVGTQMGC